MDRLIFLALTFDSAPWKSTTMGITKYLQSMRLCWGSAEADLITSLIKSSDDINGIFWHQGLRILLLNYTYIPSGYQKLGWSPMHWLELIFYYQASVVINLPLEIPGSNPCWKKTIFFSFCLFSIFWGLILSRSSAHATLRWLLCCYSITAQESVLHIAEH